MAKEGEKLLEPLGKTFGSFIEERLANPLISSFVIAWCLYNYRFFVIVFSKNALSEKFNLIHERFPDGWAILINGFIVPCIFAAIYLFLLPKPSLWVYKRWRQRQKEMDDVRTEYDGQIRLTVDESRELRAKLREKEAEIDKVSEDVRKLKDDLRTADEKFAESIAGLRRITDERNEAVAQRDAMANELATLRQLQSNWKTLDRITSDNTEQLERRPQQLSVERSKQREGSNTVSITAAQELIIRTISEHPNFDRADLLNLVPGDRLRAEHALEDLAERDMIRVDYDNVRDTTTYTITQKGRRAVLDKRDRRMPEEDIPVSARGPNS